MESLLDASANVIVAIFTVVLFVFEFWRYRHESALADERHRFEKRVARANYDLALFDKRMEIYLQIEEMLAAYMRKGRPVPEEALKLSYKARNASFLFPSTVTDYLDRMVQLAHEHHFEQLTWEPLRARGFAGEDLAETDVIASDKALKRMHEIENWFRTQVSGKAFRVVFEPYLKLPQTLD